jgi:hypothetical protein
MHSTDGRGQMPALGEPTDSTSAAHPLDNVIWSALTSRNRNVAEGDGLALRYPASIAPFAAMIEPTIARFQSLSAILPAGDRIALFTLEEVIPPSFFSVVQRDTVDQMVLGGLPAQGGSVPVVRLEARDVPDILALVEATHPGPFGPRTIELGQYIGIRRDGILVAMAGSACGSMASPKSALCASILPAEDRGSRLRL